jgi:hypothetical protein
MIIVGNAISVMGSEKTLSIVKYYFLRQTSRGLIRTSADYFLLPNMSGTRLISHLVDSNAVEN